MYMAYNTNPTMPRVRMDAVRLVRSGWSQAKVARYLGYPQGTISKWVKRAPQDGRKNIPTMSSRPHHSPRVLPQMIVDAIVLEREKRNRCAEVVHDGLRKNNIIVSLSSVKRTLERQGLVKKRSPWKRWHDTFPRPIAEKPGDLTQIDTIHIQPRGEMEFYVYTAMAEEDELLILSNYWRFRVEDQGAQPNDFLFGNPRDCFRVISTGIFRQLNDIIADVTGSLWTEHPAHYHHCRASFASWGLTRLLLSDDVNVPGILASVEADWMRSGQTFQPEQIRRRTQPSRSDVFLLGALLGHQHPTTTMARYFRFSSELLRAYLDRSQIMRPAPGLVEKVCRIAAGTPPQPRHERAAVYVGFGPTSEESGIGSNAESTKTGDQIQPTEPQGNQCLVEA
jgi:transposase